MKTRELQGEMAYAVRYSPHTVGLLFLLILHVFGAVRAWALDVNQIEYMQLSGSELVEALGDEARRPRAFYELCRRDRQSTDVGFKFFAAARQDPRVLVCPQGKDKPPLYAILSRADIRGKETYDVGNPDELFPTLRKPGPWMEPERPQIEVFTADGRRLSPSRKSNAFHDIIADLNGDGLVEKIGINSYSDDRWFAIDVLEVSAVKEKEQPMLAVLLNWGADEWSYRVADEDGDGIWDIEIGPRTIDGLKPKARWRWDASKGAYVGPKGKPGEHFRTLDVTRIPKQLARFKAGKLQFPEDFLAVTSEADGTVNTPVPPSFLPSTEPYRYISLKNATDAEILRFMSRGNSQIYRANRSRISWRLPEDFWKLDAKSAALAFVECNRSNKHRSSFQLAIDDRDKASAPTRCSIAFSAPAKSASYYQSPGTSYYFLRVDPGDSYLAYLQTAKPSDQGFPDSAIFEPRLVPVRYEDARKIAEIVWWLDRVRSRSIYKQSTRSSSRSDMGGEIIMRSDGRILIEYKGNLWESYEFDEWDAGYTREAFLNFAISLLTDVFTERLGNDWLQFDRPISNRDISAQLDSALFKERERKRLYDLGSKFLEWYTPEQEKISWSIAAQTAWFVESTAPPPSSPLKRTYKEIAADIVQLPANEPDPVKQKQVEQQFAALQAEIDARRHAYELFTPERLTQTITRLKDRVAAAVDTRWLPKQSSVKTESKRDAQPELTDKEQKQGGSRGNTLPDDERRVSSIIQLLQDPKSTLEEIDRAIPFLIPADALPDSLRQEEKDALLIFFQAAWFGELYQTISPNIKEARLVLMRSARVDVFERLAKRFETTNDFTQSYFLSGDLAYFAQADPARFKQRVTALFKAKIPNATGDFFWSIWAADLRELRSELESHATQSADEIETNRAVWYGHFRPDTEEQNERFHIARKIVALWSESDPVVRAKMLVAFAVAEAYEFVGTPAHFALAQRLERLARMREELRRVASELSPAARKEILAFLGRINTEWYIDDRDTLTPELCAKLDTFVREAFEIE